MSGVECAYLNGSELNSRISNQACIKSIRHERVAICMLQR
jgi:hypothetical protein